MATRSELQDWVIQALKAAGGAASILEVAKYIWEHHESELQIIRRSFLYVAVRNAVGMYEVAGAKDRSSGGNVGSRRVAPSA